MTTLDDNSFTVPSLGVQAQSQRRTQPVVGISKCGRESRDKVFISKEHSRAAALCRASPIGGAIYDLPSTLNTKGPAFTKGACVEDIFPPGGCAGVTSNDELNILVDSSQFKYERDPTMLIGTDPRGRLKDAELIKNHSAAFFGRASPGPAAIGEDYGPKFSATKPRMAMATPFGGKLPSGWQNISSMPANVGPGMYPRKDISIGKQHLSQRLNQPVNGFSRAESRTKVRNLDSVSLLDAAKSSLGKQGLSKNRSAPSVGFGGGTRNQRSRTAVCMTQEDEGPKAFMPKPFHAMPRLPMESDIMRSGGL